MKILIVNEKLIQGGTEIYCLNLKEILEKDKKNEVYLLTFDDNFEKNILNIKNKENILNVKLNSKLGKINKLLFNPFLYKKIKKEIDKVNPDKIVLNNIFYSPITQIKALKDYEIYQLVHDYSVVCPKSTCLKDDMGICKGYKYQKCSKECLYHSSKWSILFKLKLTKRMEKIRKKYVKKFISPSEKLNEYLKDYDYNSVSLNNPIRTINVQKSEKKNNAVKKFIYVGAINENKGIFRFLKAFNKFATDKNVILEILGKPSSKEDELKLEELIKNNKKIVNYGFVKNEEALSKIERAHYMVVPSLWMENYPTTVLEAMMMETIVIASNRGGIPEMLDDNRGFLFDIMDDKSILKELQKVYSLNEVEYSNIVENGRKYIEDNNSFEKYSKKINLILNQ